MLYQNLFSCYKENTFYLNQNKKDNLFKTRSIGFSYILKSTFNVDQYRFAFLSTKSSGSYWNNISMFPIFQSLFSPLSNRNVLSFSQVFVLEFVYFIFSFKIMTPFFEKWRVVRVQISKIKIINKRLRTQAKDLPMPEMESCVSWYNYSRP